MIKNGCYRKWSIKNGLPKWPFKKTTRKRWQLWSWSKMTGQNSRSPKWPWSKMVAVFFQAGNIWSVTAFMARSVDTIFRGSVADQLYFEIRFGWNPDPNPSPKSDPSSHFRTFLSDHMVMWPSHVIFKVTQIDYRWFISVCYRLRAVVSIFVILSPNTRRNVSNLIINKKYLICKQEINKE